MTRGAWLRLIAENRRTLIPLVREGFARWRKSRRSAAHEVAAERTPASAAGG